VNRCVPLLFLCLAGCSSCGEEAELTVQGDHPYVRCHLAEAPEAHEARVGALRLRYDERTLSIEGAPESTRLAVFAGPGEHPLPEAPDADLAIVIGELGEPAETLAALAAWQLPVIVVAGGAERFEPLREAFAGLEGAAAERVVDATVLRVIRIGALELVVAAGSPGGRYGAGEGSCGIGEDDVEAWALDAPEAGVRRVLLSWAGPAGSGATEGLLGADAGSPLMARIAEAAGAEGALFAWPRGAVGRPDGEGAALKLAVPPIAGVTVLRADGRRVAPGVTRLTLRPEGPGLALDSP